jgi:hypothetical protein
MFFTSDAKSNRKYLLILLFSGRQNVALEPSSNSILNSALASWTDFTLPPGDTASTGCLDLYAWLIVEQNQARTADSVPAHRIQTERDCLVITEAQPQVPTLLVVEEVFRRTRHHLAPGCCMCETGDSTTRARGGDATG